MSSGKFAFLANYNQNNGGKPQKMNDRSPAPVPTRTGDVKSIPTNVNMNMPNGATSNLNTGLFCGNTSRMPHLSKVNYEREVQRRFTNKRENMSRSERYEIEKRINKPLDLKFQ